MINRRSFFSSVAGLVAGAKSALSLSPAASASQPTCDNVGGSFVDKECTTPGYYHGHNMHICRPGGCIEMMSIVRCGGEFMDTGLYRQCHLPLNHPGKCGDPSLHGSGIEGCGNSAMDRA